MSHSRSNVRIPRRHADRAASSSDLDEAIIRKVVVRFYGRARNDDLIGPIFQHVVSDDRWAEHLDTITDFWSSMLLSTGRYAGRPMQKHLALGRLEDAHFLRWLALFRESAEEICSPRVAELFVSRATRIANSFRLNILIHNGENTIFTRPLDLGK